MNNDRKRVSSRASSLLLAGGMLLVCACASPLEIARRPNTPADKLTELARLDDQDVQLSVAAHRNTPPSVLNEFALHSSRKIREAVARNPSTPGDALVRLSDDDAASIRLVAAGSSNMPPSRLAALLDQAKERTGKATQKSLPVDSTTHIPVTRYGNTNMEYVVLRRVAETTLRIQKEISGTSYFVHVSHEWDQGNYGIGAGLGFREHLTCRVLRDGDPTVVLTIKGRELPKVILTSTYRGIQLTTGTFFLLAPESELIEELRTTIR